MKKSLIIPAALSLLLIPFLTEQISAGEGSLLASLEAEIVDLVEKAGPAVVSVTTESLSPPWWDSVDGKQFPAWIETFLRSEIGSRKRRSSGTGFIISPGGRILTTEHVIGRAREVTVTLHDGRSLPARVVGKAPLFNIAILEVEGKELPCLSLGSSSEVRRGSWVIALGQPYGLATSATWGIVSGLGRKGLGISSYEDLIQISAPVNPGDSGGPVLNCKGEVIGVIAASFSGYREFELDWDYICRFHRAFPGANAISPGSFFRSSQAQGIGFAIPIDLVKEVVTALEENISIGQGWLGLFLEVLPGQEGAVVTGIVPGSPAAQAGLQDGDVILSLNDRRIASPQDLQRAVFFSPVGETVTMGVQRGEKTVTLDITIEERVVATGGERL